MLTTKWQRVVLFSLLLGYLGGCSESDIQSQVSETSPPMTVKTLALVSEPLAYTVDSYGELKVADRIMVGVESAGVITAIHRQEGQEVQAEQVLFSLDSKKQQLRYEKTAAVVDQARSQLAQVEQTYLRFKSLRHNGAASQEQLEQAKFNVDASAARLQEALAALSIARAELSDRTIHSSVNGVVEGESIEVGQHVQPGQTLVVIQAEGALQVIAHVNEAEVLQVVVGLEAQVTVAGTEYRALVESVGRTASTMTGNYPVKLRIQNRDNYLREGMSAQIRLPVVSDQSVIHVPRSAVVDRNRKRVVFTVEEGRVAAKSVRLGLPDRGRLPVLAGLLEGEQLIIDPLPLLSAGVAVTVEAVGR